MEGTLGQEKDFTVKTTGIEGVSYTHDREHYLQLGLEIAQEQLDCLIDDVKERAERKSKFSLVKK